MKTMKLGDKILRINEKDVDGKLKIGWKFCQKKEWKDNFRVLKNIKPQQKTKKK